MKITDEERMLGFDEEQYEEIMDSGERALQQASLALCASIAGVVDNKGRPK